MIRSLLRHSSLRYLVVGGLSYCTDAGTLWLLHGVLSVPLAVATTLAFAASFVVNFGLNRAVVFAGGTGLGGQLLRYVTLVIVNYLVTLGIVLGLSTVGVNYLAAKTIAVILIAVANYFAYKHWVFADRSRAAGVAPLEREYT